MSIENLLRMMRETQPKASALWSYPMCPCDELKAAHAARDKYRDKALALECERRLVSHHHACRLKCEFENDKYCRDVVRAVDA